MEENIENTDYNKKDIPKYIIIKEYKYSFKNELKNGNYSYRCYHRNCKVLITINKENLDKIKNDNKFEYTTNNKEHSCNLNKPIIEDINNVNTENEIINLATDLIKNQIDRSLTWHIENLNNNNIFLSKIKIKNILQKVREIKYDSDNDFLLNIANITIDFSKNDPKLKNLPFCFSYEKFINKHKNTIREEKFIIFTSLFQFKKFKKHISNFYGWHF